MDNLSAGTASPFSLKKRSERTSRLSSAAIGFRLDSGISSTDSNGSQKLDGFPLESLDAFPWNHWMTSIGISGCFRLEWVDDLPRNTHRTEHHGTAPMLICKP